MPSAYFDAARPPLGEIGCAGFRLNKYKADLKTALEKGFAQAVGKTVRQLGVVFIDDRHRGVDQLELYPTRRRNDRERERIDD